MLHWEKRQTLDAFVVKTALNAFVENAMARKAKLGKHEWHLCVANGYSMNKQNALAQLICCPMSPHSKCF